MHWLTILFIAAVTASTTLELWLAHRQAGAVGVHRDRVPEPFASRISLEDHRKAADYTIAKVRLGRIGTVLNAGLTLALTVGGGIASLDGLWRGTGWGQPWLGAAVIATVACAVGVVNLPLSLWRTFRLERHFGFNRTSLMLFLADLGRGLLLAVLLGGPLLVATIMLMERAGRWWWAWVWCVWLGSSSHDVGLAGLHRAAVQSVLAARGPPAQGPDRGAARALRIQLQRRVRHGRLTPLEAR